MPNRPASNVVLACDLGGSSFRAALIDDAGATLAQVAVLAPSAFGEVDAREHGPEAWWSVLVAACRDLARQDGPAFAAARGVAICGVTRAQVFLGRQGGSLRDAMLWSDTRAEGAAARLREAMPADHPEREGMNAFHPLARIAWLREAEPETFARLAMVVDPKDYLNFRLTGVRASDFVSMARLAAAGADRLWPEVGRSFLPPLMALAERVGSVLAGPGWPFNALAGVPVFCGSHDTWAAALGLGAMRHGRAYNISGTTEVLGVLSGTPAVAEGLLTVDWGGLYQIGGPSQTGADAATWLLSLLGRESEEQGSSLDALLDAPRHPQPLLFLPYLRGERTPHWDPALRGAFIGLGREHGAGDLAWAVLEGVALQNRLVLERAEAALGAPVSEIRFGGGGAANARWRQIKADVCGRPVVAGAREPGLLGAAMVAWTGLGRFASLAEAGEVMSRETGRHEPTIADHARYDALYALFRQSEGAVAPISRALAGLTARAIASTGGDPG